MVSNYIPCARVKLVNEKELAVILMEFFNDDITELLAFTTYNQDMYCNDDFSLSNNADGLYLVVNRKTKATWLFSLAWMEEDAEFYIIDSNSMSILKDDFDYKPYRLGEYFVVPYGEFHANLRHVDNAPF